MYQRIRGWRHALRDIRENHRRPGRAGASAAHGQFQQGLQGAQQAGEGSPVVRVWNVVHTLSRVLSPAAEAFRSVVLERGEACLAEHFFPRTCRRRRAKDLAPKLPSSSSR